MLSISFLWSYDVNMPLCTVVIFIWFYQRDLKISDPWGVKWSERMRGFYAWEFSYNYEVCKGSEKSFLIS